MTPTPEQMFIATLLLATTFFAASSHAETASVSANLNPHSSYDSRHHLLVRSDLMIRSAIHKDVAKPAGELRLFGVPDAKIIVNKRRHSFLSWD